MALIFNICVLLSFYMLMYMGMIQEVLRIWSCICHFAERNFISIFFTKACSFHWNQFPSCLKESISLNDFSHNHRLLYGWRLSELMMFFMCTSGIRLHLILIGLFIQDLYLCVHICVRIFHSVTGHHGRTDWLSGIPCTNTYIPNKKIYAWLTYLQFCQYPNR